MSAEMLSLETLTPRGLRNEVRRHDRLGADGPVPGQRGHDVVPGERGRAVGDGSLTSDCKRRGPPGTKRAARGAGRTPTRHRNRHGHDNGTYSRHTSLAIQSPSSYPNE